MTFVGTVAKADQPVDVVPQVIADLFFRFRGDLPDAINRALLQFFKQCQVEGVEQHEPGDRITEMAIWLLEQQEVFEFVFVAQECEIVFAPSLAFEFPRIGIEHARLSDVIEREVRVRKLFLQFGIGCDEFHHALAENQRVITQPRDVRKQCVLPVHRFSTPSGIS